MPVPKKRHAILVTPGQLWLTLKPCWGPNLQQGQSQQGTDLELKLMWWGPCRQLTELGGHGLTAHQANMGRVHAWLPGVVPEVVQIIFLAGKRGEV